MKISALIRFLSCAFVATALLQTALAQTDPGGIHAAKVQGQVLKLAHDGTSSPLKDGAVLAETDTVTTGKDSSVVLVFNNGSTVRLGSESRLGIDEFKMDPLAANVNASTLKAEPTKSKTALNLAYGEMVGDVKKLNTASSYSIKTPVGAAGIRGTIYRIVFRPSADGKAFFTVSTQEGRVVMQGITDVEIPVVEGKEVVVEIDVPTDNAAPAAAPKVVTQDIPATTKEAFVTASASITQVLTETVLSNTPAPTSQPDPTPPTTPTPETKTDPTPPPPTPNPTPTAPPLTPGAGK